MGIIPANALKKQFKAVWNEYLDKNGKDILVEATPLAVSCPNCIQDGNRNKSLNVYNTSFIRPVNIFPGTPNQITVFPQPFNVTTVSGVQYDPANLNPKILTTAVCPVCIGEGKLVAKIFHTIKAVITWNPEERLKDTSQGWEGDPICRIKVHNSNYALVRDAIRFVVDGVSCKLDIAPRVKGLGGDHLVEAYLITTAPGHSLTNNYNSDTRVNVNTIGTISDQAPPVTPTIPPVVPGDDVW